MIRAITVLDQSCRRLLPTLCTFSAVQIPNLGPQVAPAWKTARHSLSTPSPVLSVRAYTLPHTTSCLPEHRTAPHMQSPGRPGNAACYVLMATCWLHKCFSTATSAPGSGRDTRHDCTEPKLPTASSNLTPYPAPSLLLPSHDTPTNTVIRPHTAVNCMKIQQYATLFFMQSLTSSIWLSEVRNSTRLRRRPVARHAPTPPPPPAPTYSRSPIRHSRICDTPSSIPRDPNTR